MIDALKRREKIVQENAFKQKKKKPRLKFNPGLALICLQTTGPSALKNTGKNMLAVFEPTLLYVEKVGEVFMVVWFTTTSVITSTSVIKGKYKCEPQLLS